MNEEERKIFSEVKILIKWFLMAFTVMAICFTVAIISVSVSWAVTARGASHDYFYSDYETAPTIEQSIDVRSGE